MFEKTGNVPSADIAEVLGIPIDTITADIKTLFEKLAHETNQSKQDHSDSVELQNIKHKNTIKEIYARKN